MLSRNSLLLVVAYLSLMPDHFNAAQQSKLTGSGCAPRGALPTNIRVTAIPSPYYAEGTQSFFGDLLEALKGKTGINYTVTSRPDLGYGSPDANGSFEGSLIGELVNGHADLAGADLTITAERSAVVDFLVPYAQYQLQILANAFFGLDEDTQYLIQDTADFTFLKNSKNATLSAIAANVELGRRSGSIVEDDVAGCAKVMMGNYAYVAESMFPERAIVANPQKLVRAGGTLGIFFLALAVQQDSPLRGILNHALVQLAEDGLIQDLLAKYNVLT
ncbi:hypothetical protein BV898_02999 [Hypsibius exemplaris]|uniref:Ionotropic glutamate receptor C-terminal domain-containing protein n=1 Tax=Hypsibius exemplaris TaxID=2072580 RepID=A0A1W0X5S5_HYPEX|nr:hypothetical protein BV898_02999 [Hypsibius exemplaris]